MSSIEANNHVYDLIVVGAGVVGSATAWAAARKGHSVMLLEKGQFGHNQGSSAGESRIIRRTYPETHYANMMPRSYEQWQLVQEMGGDDKILMSTGGLDFGPKDGKTFQTLLDTCAACGVEIEHLDGDKLAKRFPGMKLPPDQRCIYSPSSGILRASQCVAALQRVAANAGVIEKDNTPVQSVREGTLGTQRIAEVDTPDGTYRARAVVMATGGWVPAMLKRDFGLIIPRRRLHPYATGVSYWKLSKKWSGKFNADGLGTVIDYTPDFEVYGIGALEHPEWMKMCLHVICTEEFAIDDMDDMNKRFLELGDRFKSKSEQLLSTWLRRHFEPGVFEEPLAICHFEPCVYTMAEDEDFIIDSVGSAQAGAGRVVVVSACSGHGFKTAPVTGSAAAALALVGADAAVAELCLESVEQLQRTFGLRRLISDAGDVRAYSAGVKFDLQPSSKL